MFRGRLWGRRKWFWIADAVLLPVVLVLALTDHNGPFVFAWWVIIAGRLVSIATYLWAWRARQRRAADDARNNGVMPVS